MPKFTVSYYEHMCEQRAPCHYTREVLLTRQSLKLPWEHWEKMNSVDAFQIYHIILPTLPFQSWNNALVCSCQSRRPVSFVYPWRWMDAAKIQKCLRYMTVQLTDHSVNALLESDGYLMSSSIDKVIPKRCFCVCFLQRSQKNFNDLQRSETDEVPTKHDPSGFNIYSLFL